ncbi:serine hydrolase [Pelomonas sp. SE-A7]|uniref:serine hydrolase domain-containing protein n=1 Tax=Pelomonas sp. SE-A7 TaxID=3054953 RepID=UPI00259CBB64|nr:serine hydrolase [Pelomonas sp. SE-A7]MDM4768018.1 serine hydrolase [Pelomonas sp. SE-A7]
MLRRRELCLVPLLALPSSRAASSSDAFERITPEAAGYDAAKLQALAGFLERSGSESLLLLHQGRVFFEWGDIRRRRLVHSIRKCLLSSLVGRAVARGQIDLQATLEQLGIDDLQPLSPAEKQARLLDLLASRSGVYHPAAAESPAMEAARPARGSAAPGSRYYYNNWDFNLVGALLEKASGRSLYESFLDELARPLGMRDYQGRIGRQRDAELDGYYQLEAEKSRYPAYHFRLSAHDLALYGQLWLQRGRWQGRELVPADWVTRSTQPISLLEPEWGHAYGLLWDVLVPEAGSVHPPSFFHTGVDVHMLGVYPQHGLVLVHRVDTESEAGSRFQPLDLVRVIRQVHGARRPADARA